LAKFFHFTPNEKGEQENVRFIVNEDTVLNIIPVDYAQSDCKHFERDDIEQLNIVNKQYDKRFEDYEGSRLQ
jgi:hypothetical protein